MAAPPPPPPDKARKRSASVWVPRAVKRVEREEALQQVPAEAGAPAGAGPVDVADLEDLEDGGHEPEGKRARSHTPAAAPAAAPAAEAPGPAPEDELIEGAPRLAMHVRSAAKCIKVAAAVFALLESGAVTERSAPSVFLVVEAAMKDALRPVREAKYRVAYRRLVGAAHARRALFPEPQQAALERYQSQLNWSLELATADDSFAFMRAARRVTETLQRLKPDVMPPGKDAAAYAPPEEAAAWAPTLMCCLEAAMTRLAHPWAKPTVEGLLREAMARRRQWPGDAAGQVENWHQECKAGALSRQAGRAGPGPDAFRTAFDRDSARWRSADVSVAKKSDGSDRGLC